MAAAAAARQQGGRPGRQAGPGRDEAPATNPACTGTVSQAAPGTQATGSQRGNHRDAENQTPMARTCTSAMRHRWTNGHHTSPFLL